MAVVITMHKELWGEDRLPDDDGGHLIARMFGGSKDIDNLRRKVNISTVHLRIMVNGISWKNYGKRQSSLENQ